MSSEQAKYSELQLDIFILSWKVINEIDNWLNYLVTKLIALPKVNKTIMVNHSSKNIPKYSDITSLVEGPSLSVMIKVWQDIANSEMRIEMMSELSELGVGFNEVEEFNLGLFQNLRSEKMKNLGTKSEKRIVKVAMEVKFRDEKYHKAELTKLRNKERRNLETRLGKNSRPYRRVIRFLQNEAKEIKEQGFKKYKEKIAHLRKKHKLEETEKLDIVPEEIADFSKLSVFKNDKFEEIVKDECTITLVGEVKIDSDEEAAMKLPPNFSVMQKLPKDGLAYEQEAAYAKLRMDLRRKREQEEAESCDHAHRAEETAEELEKRKESNEEEEAKSRQVYDPINGEFDPRRRRVTDLQECDRVYLPKPLDVIDEANIEARRAMHSKVYEDYRKKHCDKDDDQKTNLNENEARGIKKIQKRLQERELVYLKTDKSGKGCLATVEKYRELGKEHVEKD